MSVDPHLKQTFLDRLDKIIEANVTNPQFGVSELAREIGISRSLLHRRLKSYLNQSVSKYIRTVRLKKAKELLKANKLSSAEIAYQVGFSSPSYFNYCFHEEFGYTPGGYKKNIEHYENTAAKTINRVDTIVTGKTGISTNNIPLAKNKIIQWSGTMVIISALVMAFYFLIIGNISDKRAAISEITIAIPPFINLSNDPENAYFSEGIRDDLLNDLHWVTSMRVLPQASAEEFRKKEKSTVEIARKLKVDYILDGSIRLYNGKVRINVKLIDPYGEKHLWSSNYDRQFEDIIGIQDEIAIEVASRVKAILNENEVRRINKISTRNSRAYDYYLRARFLLHKANSEQRYDFDRQSVQNCIQYYEKAIAEDENFPEAYAGLANAWFNLSAWGFLPVQDGFLKAKALCEKALSIDPDCAEAHAILGAFYIWGQRDFAKGREEYEISIQLNPNFATSRQGYAQFLMISGPIEEARRQIDVALTLEPYFWVIQNLSAWIHYFEGNHEEAIEACLIAKDLKPRFIENEWLFFINYTKLGRGKEAADILKEIIKHQPGTENLATEINKSYEQSGIKGLFRLLIDINENRPIPLQGLSGHPFYLAWWNAVLENEDETIFWLNKIHESPKKLYVYSNLLVNHPDFKFLRDNPAMPGIIDQFGLSTYLN